MRNVDYMVENELDVIAEAIAGYGDEPCARCAYRGSCEEGLEHYDDACEDGILEWLGSERRE